MTTRARLEQTRTNGGRSTPLRRGRRRRGERGQVVVIFAFALIVLLSMLAVSLDGSYGFVQVRRSQNGADFASLAATRKLSAMCLRGQLPPANTTIYATIQEIMDANAADVGSHWTATYLDGVGNDTRVPIDNSGNYPPPQACGVAVLAHPQWRTYLAGIFGNNTLGATTGASSVNRPKDGPPASIVALNKVGPHAVLAGGSGQFVVSGDVFANSTNRQYWTQNLNGFTYNDVVDAKDVSNLYVYGEIHTAQTAGPLPLFPLDWCLGTAGMVNAPGNPGTSYDPTRPPNLNRPINQPQCSAPGEHPIVDYNHIRTDWPPIDDPLAAAGVLPDPIADSGAGLCPGQTTPTVFTTPPVGSPVLQPGTYDFPMHITGHTEFADCSGRLNATMADNYPGMFRFPQGLWIDPNPNVSVLGYNVTLAIGQPLPLAGNVPGGLDGNGKFVAAGRNGNGAPCFPLGATTYKNGPLPDTAAPCGGTGQSGDRKPLYGVSAFNMGSFVQTPGQSGTGTNFSLLMDGGAGSTIALTAPKFGAYHDVSLFQRPTVEANFGMNAASGDAPRNSADITVNGVVYNASLRNYGMNAGGGVSVPYYWDTGIPVEAGGTLQTGYGTGGGNDHPASTGSVHVNGICVVDDFNTDGNTNITIVGRPYNFPGLGLGPGLTG